MSVQNELIDHTTMKCLFVQTVSKFDGRLTVRSGLNTNAAQSTLTDVIVSVFCPAMVFKARLTIKRSVQHELRDSKTSKCLFVQTVRNYDVSRDR